MLMMHAYLCVDDDDDDMCVCVVGLFNFFYTDLIEIDILRDVMGWMDN